MAYVKLPEELRSWEILLPDGGASRFEFSVFAGEAIGVDMHDGEDGKTGASLHIQSQRGKRRFDFSQLPVSFRPGDVAGVLAVLPEDEEDGPILCVANLDSDQRVDFLSREPELLRLTTDETVDLRGAALGASDILGGLARGAGVGAVVAALTALVLAGLEAGAGALTGGVSGFAVGAVSILLDSGVPTVAGAVGGFLAFGGLLTLRTLQLSRRSRFQRRLLDHVWRGAGDALGFVQDHLDAFRFSSTIVDPNGGGASPQRGRTEPNGTSAPGDAPAQLSGSQRRAVEDAQLLPIGPEEAGADASVSIGDDRATATQAAASHHVVRTARCTKQAGFTEMAPRRDAAKQAAAQRLAQRFESGAAADRMAALAQARAARRRTRPRGSDVPTQHVAAARAQLESDLEQQSASARLARLAEGLRAASKHSDRADDSAAAAPAEMRADDAQFR